MKRTLLSLLILSLALLGCSSSDADANPNSGGTVSFAMTDAPSDEASSLNVTISSIVLISEGDDEEGGEAVEGESAVLTIDEGQRTFDVLDLRNGETVMLGDLQVEAGMYSQLRLIVDSAEIVFDEGTEGEVSHPVKVPSGPQTGLKIPVDGELLASGGTTTLVLLDFDARRIVEQGNGNYSLPPTAIRAVVEAGGIEGVVVDAAAVEGEDAAVEGAVVTVYDVDGNEVVSTITEADGSFAVISLLEGEYSATVEAEGYESVTFNGLTVSAGGSLALDNTPEVEGNTVALVPTVVEIVE